MVGASMIGVRFLQGTSVTLRYFHQDNLGSVAVLTDASGIVAEPDAYDPWGKRRFVNGNDDPANGIASPAAASPAEDATAPPGAAPPA